MGRVPIDWQDPRAPATVHCPKLGTAMLVADCWAVKLVEESEATKANSSIERKCEFFDYMAIGVIYCNHPNAGR